MPLGILAWIFAKDDLKAMDAGMMDQGGRSNTEAGRICGMISTILTIIIFSLAGIVFAVGFISALLSPHR